MLLILWLCVRGRFVTSRDGRVTRCSCHACYQRKLICQHTWGLVHPWLEVWGVVCRHVFECAYSVQQCKLLLRRLAAPGLTTPQRDISLAPTLTLCTDESMNAALLFHGPFSMPESVWQSVWIECGVCFVICLFVQVYVLYSDQPLANPRKVCLRNCSVL